MSQEVTKILSRENQDQLSTLCIEHLLLGNTPKVSTHAVTLAAQHRIYELKSFDALLSDHKRVCSVNYPEDIIVSSASEGEDSV